MAHPGHALGPRAASRGTSGLAEERAGERVDPLPPRRGLIRQSPERPIGDLAIPYVGWEACQGHDENPPVSSYQRGYQLAMLGPRDFVDSHARAHA